MFGVVSSQLQVGVEVEAVYLWLLWGLSLTSVVGVRGQRLDLLWLLSEAFCRGLLPFVTWGADHSEPGAVEVKVRHMYALKHTHTKNSVKSTELSCEWVVLSLKVYLRWKWACVSKCIDLSHHISVFFCAQVVFLPGFGCLYIDMEYEKGTLVLSLAPEGSVDAVINQHSRYVCTGSGFIVVVLCSLHIWTIRNHPCMLFFLTSRYLPLCLFIVFTSNCFMIIVNSNVFMQKLLLDSKHEETGIIFTTGGQ